MLSNPVKTTILPPGAHIALTMSSLTTITSQLSPSR
uniref:Uncharacterized protein n=1 Tax=Arundo donax TaxID=35708 RepID=A0A0A9A7N5_ARUDO